MTVLTRAVLSLTILAPLAAIACGPSAAGGGADGGVTTDPCQPGQVRCLGQSHQTCQNGFFTEDQSCTGSTVCDTDLGCPECSPSNPKTCVGDEVHTCNQDGTVGGLLETCEFEQCRGGVCGGSDGCAQGAELIYVVDIDNNLYSFDPQLLPGDPFHLIGQLNCPAGSPYPAFDPSGGPATPFSMSVDRTATAWVLYDSGEIFHVSTTDASCQASGFTKGQSGFELFGMGFVSNSAGSTDETLYIAGGAAGSQTGGGNLGKIDPTTMQVSSVGALPSNAEFSPELTGTGDANLYGYYPGMTTSYVAQINQGTAANGMTWNLPTLTAQIKGWAFAQWGGEFYIFITTTDALGLSDHSYVEKLDPSGSGTTTTVLDNTGKVVVGAGVSTCAPVVVN